MQRAAAPRKRLTVNPIDAFLASAMEASGSAIGRG
jgi:hypothetical protein